MLLRRPLRANQHSKDKCRRGRTCVVHQLRVLWVGDDERDQVGLDHPVLAERKEGFAPDGVVLAQEALQVLEAVCVQLGSLTAYGEK